MERKHTPLPYWVAGNDTDVVANIPGYTTNWILAQCKVAERVMGGIETFPSSENAKFIVRACNAHYDLIEALDALVSVVQYATHLPFHGEIQDARAALAKAKGDQS